MSAELPTWGRLIEEGHPSDSHRWQLYLREDTALDFPLGPRWVDEPSAVAFARMLDEKIGGAR